MKILLPVLLGLSFPASIALSQESVPPAKKALNANIYEKEKTGSISGKVKATKTSREDTLVYFEDIKKSGPYILSGTMKNYTKYKNRLVKSSEANGAKVSVSIDDQDNILSVELGESSEAADSPKD